MRTPITPVLRLILVGALFVGACGGTATQSKPAAAPTTSTTAAPTAPAPTTAPQRQALGTIDPCVVGAWKGQEFTLPGPIPDLDASGGANARMLIRADGRTTWNFDGMDPLTSTDDQIDVTTSLYSNSETDGFVKALDGDWEVTSDFSGVGAWREDNILGRTNLKAGPGLFVGALNGSYTCRGDLLSYRTLDPVENATVNVLLDRVK